MKNIDLGNLLFGCRCKNKSILDWFNMQKNKCRYAFRINKLYHQTNPIEDNCLSIFKLAVTIASLLFVFGILL